MGMVLENYQIVYDNWFQNVPNYEPEGCDEQVMLKYAIWNIFLNASTNKCQEDGTNHDGFPITTSDILYKWLKTEELI